MRDSQGWGVCVACLSSPRLSIDTQEWTRTRLCWFHGVAFLFRFLSHLTKLFLHSPSMLASQDLIPFTSFKQSPTGVFLPFVTHSCRRHTTSPFFCRTNSYLHDDFASLGLARTRLPADHDGLRALAVLRRRCCHVAVRLVRDGVDVGRLGLDEVRVVGPTLAIHLAQVFNASWFFSALDTVYDITR